MQLARTTSWRIGWDVPEELQFCGYVGRHEGYSVAPAAPVASRVEAAWRAWWQALPARIASIESDLPAAPAVSPVEQLRTLAERRQAIFSPPDFSMLAAAPALRERCRRYWPDFQAGWGAVGGMKWTLTHGLHEQIQRANLNRIVKDCTRAAGKRVSAPFALRVDLVQWPEDYRRALSDAHVVLGVRYLEREWVEALRELLRKHIVRLV